LEDCCSELRKEIVRLALRKERRFVPRTKNMPCHWNPTTVENPEVGIPFNDIAAWHFIARLVEDGHDLEEVVLDQPAGDKGYVMSVHLEANVSRLYIKFQLKNGNIFGRSFHYCTR